MQRISRRVGSLAGELAEVIRAVGVGDELAEKTLVDGRLAATGGQCVLGGELALEFFTQLLRGIAFERVLGIVGNVDDVVVGIAILFTDAEHDAARHPALHQVQVTKPDWPVAYTGMDLAINHRKDHCVIVGFDIFFQQRQFSGCSHCRFLTGNELLGHCRFLLRSRCLEKRLDTGLILRADIQLAAE
ncbi:hypothetical protein D3C87_1052770 [compost metagenome]